MSDEVVQILLVEDDSAIREALAELLLDEGYQVSVAAHGGLALDMLLHGLRPNLILLDLMMPVMDGWELLARLQGVAELSEIPVVVVSAARESLPEGASVYLHKPLDVCTLLDTLQDFNHGMPPLLHPAEVPAPPQASSISAR